MRTPALLLFLLACPALAAAQAVAPALVASDGDAAHSIRLARVDVEARILGGMAETKMTMTFANPLGRQREGDLYFPLPEGAAVCGYALDIQGKMVDGVFVDRQQAQHAYETIVRRMTDPALLELVEGNTFRARVFPIPPNGTRTIAVRYVTRLAEGEDGPQYELPLNFKDKLDAFRLRIEAEKTGGKPKVVKGGLPGLAFAAKGDRFVAEAVVEDSAMTQAVAVALPQAAGQVVAVQKTTDGRTYFCIRSTLPAGPQVGDRPPGTPKHITILWDGSGSRAAQDHSREIRLLASYLARLRQAPVTVDLVVFRHEAAAPERFTVEGGRAEALLEAIRAIDYDGGTQLASIPPPAPDPSSAAAALPLRRVDTPDLYLLFTDGVTTFGKEKPGRFGAPVYVLVAGKAADRALLGRLPLASGGAFLDLDRITDDEVLAEIGRPGFRFLGAEVVSGRVAGLCPTHLRFITGPVTVAGVLEGDEAVIALKYGWTGKDRREVRLTVSAREAAQGSLLQFVWARTKVADLMAAANPDETEIARIGKQCGVVTPYTSLIVLESLDQHLEFGIRPPATLPEMRKAYDEAVGTGEALQAKGVPPQADPAAGRLYDALLPWYFRVALWEEEHPQPPDFRYKSKTRPGEPSGDEPVAPGGVAAPFMTRLYYGTAGSEWGGGGRRSGLFGGGGGLFGGGGTFSVLAAASGGSGFAPRFEGTGAWQQAGGLPVQDLVATVPDFDQPVEKPEEPTGIGQRRPRPENQAGDETLTVQPEEDLPLGDPETPYLRTLASAPPEEAWPVYLAERKSYAMSPAFYINCADFFLRRGQRDRGVQVLSNLSELGWVGPMRTMAYRLMQLGMPDLAEMAFREAIAIDPESPASYRDLAMLLAGQGKNERALELFYKVALGPWQDLLEGSGPAALMELNRLVPKVDPAVVKRLGIDRRLIRLLDADLRVVLSWDADTADIDLSVIEPSGEKCCFNHAATAIGGQLWLDFTFGGGPEEYLLRRAMDGTYTIQVSYFSPCWPDMTPSVFVRVDVFTNYGQPNEKHESFVLQLDREGQVATVKELQFRRATR